MDFHELEDCGFCLDRNAFHLFVSLFLAGKQALYYNLVQDLFWVSSEQSEPQEDLEEEILAFSFDKKISVDSVVVQVKFNTDAMPVTLKQIICFNL